MNPMWRENNNQPDEPLWVQILCAIIMVIMFVFMAWFAGALQEHYDCISGVRPEVCIPADFQDK